MVPNTFKFRKPYELRRSGVHGSDADKRIVINTLSQALGTSLIFKRGRQWRSRLSLNLVHQLTHSNPTHQLTSMTIFQLRLRTNSCSRSDQFEGDWEDIGAIASPKLNLTLTQSQPSFSFYGAEQPSIGHLHRNDVLSS